MALTGATSTWALRTFRPGEPFQVILTREISINAHRNGRGKKAFEVKGKKLVLAIEDAGIDILHRCGGNARCTTSGSWFLPVKPPRWEMLGGGEAQIPISPRIRGFLARSASTPTWKLRH